MSSSRSPPSDHPRPARSRTRSHDRANHSDSLRKPIARGGQHRQPSENSRNTRNSGSIAGGRTMRQLLGVSGLLALAILGFTGVSADLPPFVADPLVQVS